MSRELELIVGTEWSGEVLARVLAMRRPFATICWGTHGQMGVNGARDRRGDSDQLLLNYSQLRAGVHTDRQLHTLETQT